MRLKVNNICALLQTNICFASCVFCYSRKYFSCMNNCVFLPCVRKFFTHVRKLRRLNQCGNQRGVITVLYITLYFLFNIISNVRGLNCHFYSLRRFIRKDNIITRYTFNCFSNVLYRDLDSFQNYCIYTIC